MQKELRNSGRTPKRVKDREESMKPGGHFHKPTGINPGSRRKSSGGRRYKRSFHHQVLDMTAVNRLLQAGLCTGRELTPAVPVAGHQVMEELFRRAGQGKQ